MEDEKLTKTYEFNHLKKNAAHKYYKKYYGNITKVCKKVGICRVTFHDWLKNDPLFKTAIDEIQPDVDLIDLAMKGLVKHLNGYKTLEVKEVQDAEGTVKEKTVTEKEMAAAKWAIELVLRDKAGWGKENKVNEPIINIIIQSDTPNAGD